MANYLDESGLNLYDRLIKAYIGDAIDDVESATTEAIAKLAKALKFKGLIGQDGDVIMHDDDSPYLGAEVGDVYFVSPPKVHGEPVKVKVTYYDGAGDLHTEEEMESGDALICIQKMSGSDKTTLQWGVLNVNWNVMNNGATLSNATTTTLATIGGVGITAKLSRDLSTLAKKIATSAFSTSASYAVGDYVTYDGKLYKCTTAHSNAEWEASHFEEVTGNMLTLGADGDIVDSGIKIGDMPLQYKGTVSGTYNLNNSLMNAKPGWVYISNGGTFDFRDASGTNHTNCETPAGVMFICLEGNSEGTMKWLVVDKDGLEWSIINGLTKWNKGTRTTVVSISQLKAGLGLGNTPMNYKGLVPGSTGVSLTSLYPNAEVGDAYFMIRDGGAGVDYFDSEGESQYIAVQGKTQILFVCIATQPGYSTDNTYPRWALVYSPGVDFEYADSIKLRALPDNKTLQAALSEKYVKPSTGIPKTDLESAVQTSLGKADSAMQYKEVIPSSTGMNVNTLCPNAKVGEVYVVNKDGSGDFAYYDSNGEYKYIDATDEGIEAILVCIAVKPESSTDNNYPRWAVARNSKRAFTNDDKGKLDGIANFATFDIHIEDAYIRSLFDPNSSNYNE